MSHEFASLRVIAAGHTDPGQRRGLNEDAWRITDTSGTNAVLEERGYLYAVADGMGGHAAGEVASKLAIETIFAEYYGDKDFPMPPAMRLEQAILVANGKIYEQAASKMSQAGMGTTIVAAVVRDDWLIVANVGDSRAYLVRDGEPMQITRDHSWVAEQVAAGLLTEQDAQNHMYRSVVTRCLGHKPEAEVDTFENALEPGDMVLLCSDGLSNQVSAPEIAQILARYAPEQAVHELIDLANRYGGPDNITAVLLKLVDATESEAEAPLEVPQPVAVETPAAAEVPEAADRPRPASLRPVWVIPAAVLLLAICVVGIVLGVWGSGQISDWLATATPTPTVPAPTRTPTPTVPTATPAPTATPTPTVPTATPTATPTPTVPTATPTATSTPTVPTATPTHTPIPKLEP